jgi:hypothetical protein
MGVIGLQGCTNLTIAFAAQNVKLNGKIQNQAEACYNAPSGPSLPISAITKPAEEEADNKQHHRSKKKFDAGVHTA